MTTAPRRWPLWMALVATLAWLAALAFAMRAGVAPNAATAGTLAGAMLPIGFAVLTVPGLAILWLVAERLRDTAASRSEAIALEAARAAEAERRAESAAATLAAIEGRLGGLADRITAVAAPLEQRGAVLAAAEDALNAAGQRLAEQADAARTAAQRLGEALPAATAQAETLVALLVRVEDRLKAELAETETLLAGLHTRASEAGAEARAAGEQARSGLDAVTAAATAAREAVSAPLDRLVEAADATFTRTLQAADTMRDGINAQTNAMLASVDQARVTLSHIGGEAARVIDARLASLSGAVAGVGALLDTQGERADRFASDAAAALAALDGGIAASRDAAEAALAALAERLVTARDGLAALQAPIGGAEGALAGVERRLDEVGAMAATTLGALETRLPATVPMLDTLAGRIETLATDVDALAGPMTAGGNALARAQDQLDMARTAMEAAAATLTRELDAAKALVDGIETATGNIALQAASELIDVFGRVRDVAGQTAGTMRETLQGVVAEAEQALERAGTTRAETAFGAPIRDRIAELVAAQEAAAGSAGKAAERVARRLLALTETVATVESRIDEVETRMDVRARDSLGRRANALIARLNDSAVDLARLLGFDLPDAAWNDYAAGDRSAIARRLADAIEGDAGRAFARHYAHDLEFRAEAGRYLSEFEALVAQTVPDRDGKALGAALLSSQLGKLYLALGQAAGRFN